MYRGIKRCTDCEICEFTQSCVGARSHEVATSLSEIGDYGRSALWFQQTSVLLGHVSLVLGVFDGQTVDIFLNVTSNGSLLCTSLVSLHLSLSR